MKTQCGGGTGLSPQPVSPHLTPGNINLEWGRSTASPTRTWYGSKITRDVHYAFVKWYRKRYHEAAPAVPSVHLEDDAALSEWTHHLWQAGDL